MARKKSDMREQVVGQLVELFFQHGFEGTTLSLISERTGLHRASLYHHFPGGKEEMARAVIEHADRWGKDHIMKIINDGELPAPDRLRQIVHNMDEVHHSPAQLTPANAFVVGNGIALFGEYVQHWHYQGLVWLMSELLMVCGIPPDIARRRAWEYRVIWEGGLVCSRVLGDMTMFRLLMQRMPDYLLSAPDTPGILPPDAPLPRVIR